MYYFSKIIHFPRFFFSFRFGSGRRSGGNDFIDREESKHFPTRPVDRDKAEAELTLNIKKATSPEETAPKQKHVRKCIVYTWDYHSSASIWTGLRVQPILSDEVQTFKALIMVHKVLQEGHPVTVREGQQQSGWLETCARTIGHDGLRGYGALIRAYVSTILAKLRFHRQHPEFNGLFEYEEYISLKNIDDPNEGYETITDLMNLQDQIDSFQKLIFAHFRGSTNNECRISALVPQVKESYGIYRFITSMLRAMHRRTDAMDALQPLRERFNAQHSNLRKFYYECSNLKYLTGLINVPKLPQEPPNLTNSGDAPELPRRPAKTPEVKPIPPKPETPAPDIAEQARMLKEYEQKQALLQAERDAEARRQAELQAKQQRDFEEMQRMQAERERMAQEDLMRQQMAGMAAGRVAELEREILAMRGQYERDQMMLEQYDRRVKQLENEMMMVQQNINAQLASKDEMMNSLQDQVSLWRNKYEALAKLYSQLRTEHLDMLSKFKAMQLKANSAQEAIDRMERMERDIKAKNLELADMIRERDRARFDVDRLKASHKDEVERLRRDLRFAEERAEDATRSRSSETSSVIAKYNRQLNELEDSLRSKQSRIEELLRMVDEKTLEAQRLADEKDQELLILQEGMDHTIRQMTDMSLNQGETDQALNAQIDNLILDNQKKLNAIIDSIIQACVARIDDAIYELESSMQAGNESATPEYTLSMIEKAQTISMEFAAVFGLFLDGAPGGEHVEVIKTSNSLANCIAEVLVNTKGITRFASNDEAVDAMIQVGKVSGEVSLKFFSSLVSYRLNILAPQARKELVVKGNAETRNALQNLSATVEGLIPKGSTDLAKANGEIGELVDREMSMAARAIEEATKRLEGLMSRPRDQRHSAIEIQVHDAILAASLAITNAIARLIAAATESQSEIVAQGKGSSTAQAFYKRNNRWTEGLISAAKQVAYSTTYLIETADGVINGTHNLEQLIVASNEVAAATAQLVQSSRVKAELMSKTQMKLELAAKAVTEACKALVKQVKAISAKNLELKDQIDYNQMPVHEFKVKEMEVQVSIVTLEKELVDARRKLGEMRKAGYHTEDTI
ncbi:ANTH domain-containing protein [Melampsora americana]|nr:ANTH domain-containing protein [Melampsora americana]